MKSSVVVFVAAAFLLAAVPFTDALACELIIGQAWIGEAPPTARVRVAYAVISNPGSTPIAITGASSPAFGAIELHETREVDGVARMRRLGEVEVPAGASVHFQPGGKHFMLFRPTGEFDAEHGSTLSVHACGREFTVPLTQAASGPSD